MRVLILFVLTLVLSLGAHGQSRDEMLQLLANATSVKILDDRPSRNAAPRKTEVILTSTKDIGAFCAVMQLSEESVRGEKMVVDGKDVVVIPYCQCLSDFTVIALQGEKERLRFGIQHWSHTRIRSGDDVTEYDFVPSSVAALKSYLLHHFPADAQLNPKKANQSSEPMPLARHGSS